MAFFRGNSLQFLKNPLNSLKIQKLLKIPEISFKTWNFKTLKILKNPPNCFKFRQIPLNSLKFL